MHPRELDVDRLHSHAGRDAAMDEQAHKIEAHRSETGQPLIATQDPTIRAVASDSTPETERPLFDLDDTSAIADFIAGDVGL